MTRWRRALDGVTAIVVVAGVMVALAPDPHAEVRTTAAVVEQPASAPTQWALGTTVPTAPTSTAAPTSTSAPPTSLPATDPSTTTTAPPSTPPPTTVQWTPRLAAKPVSTLLTVYAQAGAATPVERLPADTYFGNTLVLPVTERAGDWLEVLLPTRPNGSEGWIKAADAVLVEIDDRVEVDLSARSLTWFHQGQPILETEVAIGAPTTPTPVGSFFVTDVLASDPASAYGAWIVALNAHSEAMQTFDGGDARIAIHGTNAPASIGTATSSGCVRADPVPLAELAHGLPLGTPVDIAA